MSILPEGRCWYAPSPTAQPELGKGYRIARERLSRYPWQALQESDGPSLPITGRLVMADWRKLQHASWDRAGRSQNAEVTVRLVVADARPVLAAMCDTAIASALETARKREALDPRDIETLDVLDRVWPLIRELGPCPKVSPTRGPDPWGEWREDYDEYAATVSLARYPMRTPKWLTDLCDALDQRLSAVSDDGQPTRHRCWAYEAAVASTTDPGQDIGYLYGVLEILWVDNLRALVLSSKEATS